MTHALLLKPLPYERPDQIVIVSENNLSRGWTSFAVSPGLYGVMSYAVSQRTHEIGVRMALGAGQRSVLLMVLRQALLLTGTGLMIGLAGAIVLGRALASVLEPLLFQVKPFDVATLTVVPAVLAAAALLATLIPARRATQVDPIQTLRNV